MRRAPRRRDTVRQNPNDTIGLPRQRSATPQVEASAPGMLQVVEQACRGGQWVNGSAKGFFGGEDRVCEPSDAGTSLIVRTRWYPESPSMVMEGKARFRMVLTMNA